MSRWFHVFDYSHPGLGVLTYVYFMIVVLLPIILYAPILLTKILIYTFYRHFALAARSTQRFVLTFTEQEFNIKVFGQDATGIQINRHKASIQTRKHYVYDRYNTQYNISTNTHIHIIMLHTRQMEHFMAIIILY